MLNKPSKGKAHRRTRCLAHSRALKIKGREKWTWHHTYINGTMGVSWCQHDRNHSPWILACASETKIAMNKKQRYEEEHSFKLVETINLTNYQTPVVRHEAKTFGEGYELHFFRLQIFDCVYLNIFLSFSDASSHLYKRVCASVRLSVGLHL